MVTCKDAHKVKKIEHNGQLVAKQVHRRIIPATWATIRTWKVGWHGTKSMDLNQVGQNCHLVR